MLCRYRNPHLSEYSTGESHGKPGRNECEAIHAESVSQRVVTAAVSKAKSFHCEFRRCVPRAPSLSDDPRPSRITRKSDRPRASDRTMVGT